MIFLRSLLFNAFYFSGSFCISAVGTLFARTPQGALATGQLWARVMVAAARRICGIQLSVTGRENLPEHGAVLIASQHQSAYDTMIWLALLPRTSYVMKAEVARIPLFGPLTVLAGMLPIERAGGAAALRGLVRLAAKAAAAGRQIVIFPEGTRAAPGIAHRLHPGVAAIAARTGLPVIPVSTDSGDRWGRKKFTKRPGTIHMKIMPPIPAGLPRAALMARLTLAFHPVDNPVGEADGSFPHEDSVPA